MSDNMPHTHLLTAQNEALQKRLHDLEIMLAVRTDQRNRAEAQVTRLEDELQVYADSDLGDVRPMLNRLLLDMNKQGYLDVSATNRWRYEIYKRLFGDNGGTRNKEVA